MLIPTTYSRYKRQEANKQSASEKPDNAPSATENAPSATDDATSSTDNASSNLAAPEGSQRRSSRSPSRPLGLDQVPFPRTLPTENIGKPPSRRPSHSPSAAGSANNNATPAPSPASVSHVQPTKSNSPRPPSANTRENSPRPPPMSPLLEPIVPSHSTIADNRNSASRPGPVRRKPPPGPSASPAAETGPQTSTISTDPPQAPGLLKPFVNPIDHTRLSPVMGASRRAGKSYFSVESDDEEVFSDDPRIKPRAKPKLASDSDRSVDEREEEDEEESDDDDDVFQPPDSRRYIPNDDADSVDDDEPEEEVDSEEDTPRQVSPPLSLQVHHLRHNSERLLSCSAHTGQGHQQHRIRQ